MAVCDVIKDNARKIGEQFDVSYFTDMDEMLNTTDIDVVSVLTKSGYHSEHVINIAK